jgi:hypothetical protein
VTAKTQSAIARKAEFLIATYGAPLAGEEASLRADAARRYSSFASADYWQGVVAAISARDAGCPVRGS